MRPPESGRAEYFDRHLPGFSLRTTDKGRKTFCLLYRINGIKRRLTIGPYTGPGSLKAARDRARKALMAVGEGRDPASEMTEARRKGDTVGEVVEDYWRYHLAGLKDGRKAKRILDQEVVARWRYRRIGQITRRDIIALVDEVVARGTTGHADKVRAWAHALMNWCLSRDLIQANPAAALRRPHKTKIRSRVLGDEELRAIWQAAAELGHPFGLVVQLLMLTGQRRSEVCRMRWDDVDPQGAPVGYGRYQGRTTPCGAARRARLRHPGGSPAARGVCVQHPARSPRFGAVKGKAAPGQGVRGRGLDFP